MIHGETAVAKSEQAAKVLFGGDLDGLDATDIQDIFADVPSSELPQSELGGDGFSVVDLLVDAKLAQSKGDARRTIKGGGLYLNNQRIENASQMVTTNDLFEGKFLVLRKGRKKYHLVKVIS
jgi:tyrosyl-tRNA synthetase